jgi:rhodanese-related sulfurtransferase
VLIENFEKTAHDLVAAAKARIQEVSLDHAKQAILEADEYAAAHIAGAIHVPRGLLEFKLSNTPELSSRDLNIVLYCKNSGRAACSLRDMGHLEVRSITGGIDAWIDAGKPVAKPVSPSFD